MNTQLVDSIVQMIRNLPVEERELVKQKLWLVGDDAAEGQERELTLEERKAFLRKPLTERQSILAQQAEQMVSHYRDSTEWQELMAGDIIDD